MTETEEEAEVAVERISLAVSSSPPGSPERPAAPTRSSVRSCWWFLVVIILAAGSPTYQVHGEGDEVFFDRLWPLLDNTGH